MKVQWHKFSEEKPSEYGYYWTYIVNWSQPYILYYIRDSEHFVDAHGPLISDYWTQVDWPEVPDE